MPQCTARLLPEEDMSRKHERTTARCCALRPASPSFPAVAHLDRFGHPLVAAADAPHDVVLARADERFAEAVVHPELLVLVHEHHQPVAGLLEAPLASVTRKNKQKSFEARHAFCMWECGELKLDC